MLDSVQKFGFRQTSNWLQAEESHGMHDSNNVITSIY